MENRTKPLAYMPKEANAEIITLRIEVLVRLKRKENSNHISLDHVELVKFENAGIEWEEGKQ